MLSKFLFAIFGLTVAASAFGPDAASAATVRATYTGTVSGSSDMTGLFGAAGGTLDGQAFELTFMFDTSAGNRESAGPGTYDAVFGGADYGVASPTLSARLTIAGHTRSLSGANGSTYYVCDADFCGANTVSSEAYDADYHFPGKSSFGLVNIAASGPDGSVPATMEAPFVLSNATGSGSFLFHVFNTATWTYDSLTYGDLTVNQVSVGAVGVAPVPLPAAGLTLVAALGGLGLAGRRRRSAAG